MELGDAKLDDFLLPVEQEVIERPRPGTREEVDLQRRPCRQEKVVSLKMDEPLRREALPPGQEICDEIVLAGNKRSYWNDVHRPAPSPKAGSQLVHI